ncbi:hypothetical protein BJ170DRAFT_713436 [Xylariales sp. AK1849]|nr:hypothetical protein BJ170DRAFT_713436 [Xylariales sp. AK1849]
MRHISIILPGLSLSHALHWDAGHDDEPIRDHLFGSSFGIPNQNATYDYVVIGCGTAGNTIAARLAEDQDVSVAAIEAGGFPWQDIGNQTEVPAYAWRFAMFTNIGRTNPTVDWDLNTAPQQNLGGRSFHYTAAKTFGGGSSLQAGVYNRVSEGTMNHWADLVGDASYKWSNFLPFYKKSTKYTPNDNIPDETENFEPHGGPVQISYPPHRQPTNPFISRAFQKLGFKKRSGFNGGLLNGYGYWTVYQDPESHTRSSSATSYLHQALKHTGLQLYPRTQAQKIMIKDGRASAVVVQTAGLNYTITARKGIILSAGFVHSPQILMVSGIGSASILKELGIEVVADLPGVGQNLQDQPYVFTTFQTDVETDSAVIVNPQRLDRERELYARSRTGPLTSPGTDLVGWEKFSPESRAKMSRQARAVLDSVPEDWPDLEISGVGISAGNPADPTNNSLFSLYGALLVHNTTGNITLSSPEIRDQPILNTNLLVTATDRELTLAGLKRLLEVANATNIVTSIVNPPESVDVESDVQLLDWISQTAVFGYHGSSTCKMGKKEDRMAVVDSKARVYGVEGLRVVDASVLPFCVPGHPSGTIYALAEKIARDILCEEKSCLSKHGSDHDEL